MLPGVYRYISRKEHKIVIQHVLQIRRALQIKKICLHIITFVQYTCTIETFLNIFQSFR